MSVRCPYCQHQMELKGAHPGRFTPKCPVCKRRFVLLIPEDANMPPLVGEMPQPAATAPANVGHDSMAGASQAGLTAAGVNAVAAPVAATAKTGAATHVAATLPPMVTAPPPGAASATRPGNGMTPPAPTSPRITMPLGGATQPEVGLAGPPGDVPLGGDIAAPPPPRTVLKEAYVPEGPTLSGSLGGYEIEQKLGEGGMGAVYLARQVSLDRPVALKVLAPQLAADPEFVARFTREAYAAAQLAHHNVVQIHDIGYDRDTNFFSMEYVPGQTLEKLVNREGKLDPEAAVGYVLQAARGLRFAHDHGLIHRDVKPDNLLLNDQGIVKVADLGLVKQAGKTEITARAAGATLAAPSSRDAGKTQLNISMGTPAYMPPEQARDAAHVDQRADIYSLGCTLYDLLTGTPPFSGKTAVEVITKHQTAAVVPPDRVARHVPPELSQVVLKMMAKRPEDRYQTMAEVVEALEGMLGIESGKTFSPKEEHVRVLETAVEQFNGSRWATLRRNLVYGFYGACGLGAVACALPQVGRPFWAGAFVGFAVLATVFYQLLVGVTRKTHLFTRVRQFAFGARLADWLKFFAAAAVVVLLLVAFNLHWSWLTAAVIAAVAAAAFHFTVDRLVDADRRTPVGHVEGMLKKMRLRGLDESALRQFVCKYSGEHWEEMYESLFGYEAKRAARRSWGKGERGRNRRRFGAWRDVIIDWIDRRTLARKEERERKLLAKIEAKALAAKGLDQASANRKAKQTAERMVDKAARVKESAERRMMMTALPTSSGRTMMFDGARPLASWADGFEEDDADTKRKRDRDGERVHESYFRRRFGTPLDFLLGPQVRVLAGAVLIAMFALWMKQSGVSVTIDGGEIATASDAVEKARNLKLDRALEVTSNVKMTGARPWSLPGVPQVICDVAGSPNGGIAGALLLLSGFFAGKRLGLAVLAGAAIALLAYRYPIPMMEGQRWIAAGIGAAIGAIGIMLFRRTAAD